MMTKVENVLRIKRVVMVVLLLLAPIATACTRLANTKSTTSGALPSSPSVMSQPINVSAEKADGAEPAVARSPGDITYVAWIEHHTNKEADLMVASFDRK